MKLQSYILKREFWPPNATEADATVSALVRDDGVLVSAPNGQTVKMEKEFFETHYQMQESE